MSDQAAFLGVEASVTGRRWVGLPSPIERMAEAMAQETKLALPLCRLLAGRGVASDLAKDYLEPQLRNLLPDPRSLKDAEKAAARIAHALNKRERVAIFADYDVDGGSSGALLVNWFQSFGMATTLYVPDRIDEGYGPNVPAMQALAAKHSLIICVDCGTLSHEPIEAAGCDVLVLDHHLGGETLPPALAVVNPNRQDEDGTLGHLCAAGVVFLVLVEVNRQLRAENIKGPDLLAMLDLVALATVADVAPLIGVNRAFVRQGLKVMARRDRPGIRALSDLARLDTAPTSHSLGFIFGPRVNAGGRIGQADLGARLLASQDPAEAMAIAQRLEELNTERRAISEQVRIEAMAQAESRGLEGPLAWAAGEGWHPGVVGIVAARLKEAVQRPSIVIGFENGIGKGSGRSIPGVDLGAAIQRLAAEGLLIKGGGHKMAAGLTVARDKLDAAMARLAELLARQGAAETGPRDLLIDSILLPEAATVPMVEQIELAGPFGASAPAPRFVIPSVPVSARKIGENHLKITARPFGAPPIDAMAFGAYDGPMGAVMQTAGHKLFHLAGKIEINSWGGKSKVQLRLDDFAESS